MHILNRGLEPDDVDLFEVQEDGDAEAGTSVLHVCALCVVRCALCVVRCALCVRVRFVLLY